MNSIPENLSNPLLNYYAVTLKSLQRVGTQSVLRDDWAHRKAFDGRVCVCARLSEFSKKEAFRCGSLFFFVQETLSKPAFMFLYGYKAKI